MAEQRFTVPIPCPSKANSYRIHRAGRRQWIAPSDEVVAAEQTIALYARRHLTDFTGPVAVKSAGRLLDGRRVERVSGGQMKKISALEEKLAGQLGAVGLPAPVREFRFVPGRMYRADFAWPNQMLLVECEGGIFARGRGWHGSVGGFLDDLEKYNLATLLGYRVLRYTAKEVKSGKAIREIEQMLKGGIQVPRQKLFDPLEAISV